MSMREDAFGVYHPAVVFLFFAGALILGMFLLHPAFLVCSVLLSAAYYGTLQWSAGMKKLVSRLLGMAGLFLFLSAINPLFNSYGDTVLFTWLRGRPYTLEALCYGMALSAMMICVLTWFGCYHAVMTSDKFLYLCGRLAPSICLVLTMVLRLVPLYRRKAVQVRGARKCIGKTTGEGDWKDRIAEGSVVLSGLVSWALDGGIVSADSMRSRGFGSGRRTSFASYPFKGRDIGALVWMALLGAVMLLCALRGGMAADYTPHMRIPGTENGYTVLGVIAYGLFLGLPTAIDLWEAIRWRIARANL